MLINKFLKKREDEKRAAAEASSRPTEESELEETGSVSEDNDDSKNEEATVRLLRTLRNKFTERNLVGSITLTRVAGITSSSVNCDVGEQSDELAVDPIDENPSDVKALQAMDRLIKNVLSRSKGMFVECIYHTVVYM